VFRAVGEWHALQQRWKQAADRFALLLSVNQLESSDVVTMDYLRAGPAPLEVGDTAAYERFRQEAIARFSAAPSPFADRILKISLLMPANARVLESLGPLASATAEALAAADAKGDAFTAAWRSLAMALLDYRRGNFLEALKWSQRCLAYPEANAPRIVTTRLISAMANFQLGRAQDAQADFLAARELIESKGNGQGDRGSPIHGFWFDWVFARVLLREASGLMGGAR
jgi:tetratricopeptide (TPR) repeat protein